LGRKTLYLVALFLISGCSYTAEAGAFDGPYLGDPNYYQPVAYTNHGQPILAQPLFIEGVPVAFNLIDNGVYELIDPEGYVIGYAYVDGIDRLRITDLDGNTLYFLHYDSGGYFRAFDPYGTYLASYAYGYLAYDYHTNRHHFNTPFFRSGSKARKLFRGRANKHRKARLRQRARHSDRRFSSRGSREGNFEGRQEHRGENRFDGNKKRRVKGSGWKPVQRSGQTLRQSNPSPRGLNTGGAVFDNDFPFQPQAAPPRNGPGKSERRKAKRRANRGQQQRQQPAATEATEQRNGPGKSERRKAKRRANRGQQQRQQPAATQAAPAPQPRQQTRRAVRADPPSPPPKANKSSEPKSEPSRRKTRSQRSQQRNTRNGPGVSPRRR
jgi:hypothetical protein